MTKTPILEFYKDNKGLYRFKLLARNGEAVAQSEGYEKKASALGAAKKLAEWTAKALLVDADKKADAASKTTGKQSLKRTAVNKAETSKANSSAHKKLGR